MPDNSSFGRLTVVAIACLAFWLWFGKQTGHENVDYYKQMATIALKNECTKECSTHGVQWHDLTGPKLEDNYAGRGYVKYLFSWNSKVSPLKIEVLIHYNPGEATVTEINWKDKG